MRFEQIQPGDVIHVRYASSSLHGGSYTDIVTVRRRDGDYLIADHGYRYHRSTVVRVEPPALPTAG